MKRIDTTFRTTDEEIMDDFQLKGKELEKTLRDLEKINKWLGGNEITINGIRKILSETSFSEKIKIVDIGCGNGSMLREISDYGRKNNLDLELKGIDANPHAIEIAKDLSKNYSETSFQTLNIFSEAFLEIKADIILCTLTLHHFKEDQISQLLNIFVKNSRLGIVVNDLQRSKFAYYLFQAFCAVFIDNEIARKDGLTSIRRAFKKEDLENLGKNLEVKSQEISWKWAFRYQWILICKDISKT